MAVQRSRISANRRTGTLHLRGSVSVQDKSELCAAVLKVSDCEGTLTVDCAELEALDLAVVQILCALHALRERAGRPVEVRGATGPAARTLESAGFAWLCASGAT